MHHRPRVRIHPDWIVPDWPAPARVQAFVTTRAGGVSSGPWGVPPDGAGGMNIGRSAGDQPDAVDANRARLRALLPQDPCWLHQVHGNRVVDADDPSATSAADGARPQADASASATRGVVCVVQAADCLPVLLTTADGGVVAAAHAGWRGVASGVIQGAVRRVRERAGDGRARILAWLGPAIGPTAFEVGPDVLVAMQATLPHAQRAFVPQQAGKYRADLYLLARQALSQEGVVDDVWGGGWCTHSDATRFYSYRRDGVTGRHAALIWIA